MSIIKVFLGHSHVHHSFPYCLWLLSCYNDVVRWLQKRPYSSQSLKYSLSGPLQKKCVDVWSGWSGFWMVTSLMLRYFSGPHFPICHSKIQKALTTKFLLKCFGQINLVAKHDLNWYEAVYNLFISCAVNIHVSCYRIINVFGYRLPPENLLGFFIIYSICIILPF